MISLLLVLLYHSAAGVYQELTSEPPGTIHYTEPGYASSNSVESGFRALTELPGGKIVRGQRRLERAKSPYVLREDLYVERDAELVLEPGVEVRFAPMIGITVRGVVLAEVSDTLQRLLPFLGWGSGRCIIASRARDGGV